MYIVMEHRSHNIFLSIRFMDPTANIGYTRASLLCRHMLVLFTHQI